MELTLIFTLGDEVYGLEIDAVQEIVEDPSLHYAPRAGGALTGAINFHGQVLAAIDLQELLGFSGEERDHRCVILTPEFRALALRVGCIQRIARLDLSALHPAPAHSRECAVRGVADLDGMMVNLLDTDEVINQLENIYGG
jgi:purine-binding chemotaxis protein CheW